MSKRPPINTVVFPVGGLGTRFLPATKAMPKEMLTVVDKPLIQYAYEEAVKAGIERAVFITGRNKNVISNHFDHVYELQHKLSADEKTHLLELTRGWLPPAGSIAFIRQQQPLGLGHAVYCARNFVKEPFAVMLADELFLSKKPFMKQIATAYEKFGGNIIGVAKVAREHTRKYGIIIPENEVAPGVIRLKGMVEKPEPKDAPSLYSITGQYILQPEIYDYLEKSGKGKDGELQLTDALNAMASKVPTHAVVFDGKRYDCGNRRGFLQANIAFALEHKEIRKDVVQMLKEFLKEYS